MNIQDLPTELLHNIIGFVAEDDHLRKPPPEREEPEFSDDEEGWRRYEEEPEPWDILDWSDLVEVCLVSRKFRDLAQPFLFRKFKDLSVIGLGKTYSFTATLCRRPDLGRSVDHIYLDPNYEPPYCINFFAGNNTVLALLLSKTPNLRSLRLPGGQFSYQPIDLLYGRDPLYLSNLKILWVECEQMSRKHDISKAERLVTLPKLELASFSGGKLSGALFPSTWTEKSVNANLLQFTMCHIDRDALPKLTQACKSLNSLTYKSYNTGADFSSSGVEFNAAQAYEALLPHKNTLEVLAISCYRASQQNENIQNYTQVKIGPLDDFYKLKTIFLPHNMLPAHPVFSGSLEELTISDCRSSIRNIVQNIATDAHDGQYPTLAKFRILTPNENAALGPLGGSNGRTFLDCYHSLSAIFSGCKPPVDFTVSHTDRLGYVMF
ncbi:unnamed protein product [Penicillium bialowiezense]